MEKTAIEVTDLGIRFYLKEEKAFSTGRLKSFVSRRKRQEFWALRNIRLGINNGDIFGIIGGNGAGKSTLLKIIAGIYPATEGSVAVNGNIVPLIELGAAFNPELTGAENIYLTGSIYKIPRKTIKENFNRIVEFSGLKRFINSPVKNYSSGMFIRLAFSIVIFFQPEIVLVDEVFSVGDQVFQQKSFEKIISFKEKGCTIVFVSHDLTTIGQICNRVLVLDEGEISFLGVPEQAIEHYLRLIKSSRSFDKEVQSAQPPAASEDATCWGNKQVSITSVCFTDEKGKPKTTFEAGEYFEAQISYVSQLKDTRPVFGVAITTVYKLIIYGPNTLETEFPEGIPEKGKVRFIIPSLPLFDGDYLFSASVYDPTLSIAYDHHEMMYHFRVLAQRSRVNGCVNIDSEWKIESG